jgi:hypothetical protein
MRIYQSKLAKGIIVVVAVGALVASSTVSFAASKTITCYKGTTVKKVSTAKCPAGYSTTAPKAATPAKAAAGSVAINATYKGTMKMVWSDSDVKVSPVAATGSGTTAGLTSLTGTGSSAPSSQCDSVNGSGTLGSGADTVQVSFDTTTQGCADSDAAPANVKLTGNAIVKGGTGKYAGATGTLKSTGSFAVKSTSAGFSETQALVLTLVGTITTK